MVPFSIVAGEGVVLLDARREARALRGLHLRVSVPPQPLRGGEGGVLGTAGEGPQEVLSV